MAHRPLNKATSARYLQEYPPPSEFTITSFVTSPSPIRRASSETRLEALHHKHVVESLERVQRGGGQAGSDRRDRNRDMDWDRPRDRPNRDRDSRDLKMLSEKGSQLFAAEVVGTHSHVPLGSSGGSATAATTGGAAACPTASTENAATQTHLNLEFEACFKEHPNTTVSPKIIGCLDVGYRWTKLVAYYIFVILIGVPLTFVWGCLNGLAVFCCVWVWGPQLKLLLLCLHSCAPALTTPVQVLCTPVVDVFARILRQVRVQAIVLGQSSVERYTSNTHTA